MASIVNHSIPALMRSALATGDLIYKQAAAGWARLAIGGANTILSVSGGLPAWRTLSALLDAVIGNVRGMLVARAASGWVSLILGTNGYCVSSNGTDVVYQNLATLLGTNFGTVGAQILQTPKGAGGTWTTSGVAAKIDVRTFSGITTTGTIDVGFTIKVLLTFGVQNDGVTVSHGACVPGGGSYSLGGNTGGGGSAALGPYGPNPANVWGVVFGNVGAGLFTNGTYNLSRGAGAQTSTLIVAALG